jgi:toxin-antitoxin system PIN domain toxin
MCNASGTKREFSVRALLDINVLIALLDVDHSFHHRAHAWWETESSQGWASCPLTENGFLRILTHPGYSKTRRFTAEALAVLLVQFVAGSDHEFWPDSLTLRDGRVFRTGHIHSSRLITDCYLLALAAHHGGRLATFDQGVVLSVSKQAAPASLCIL